MNWAPPTLPGPAKAFPASTASTMDEEGEDVGFESTTVLYDATNSAPNTTSNSVNIAGEASAYALYEPLHTEQHGVLGGAPTSISSSGSSSAVFLTPPTTSIGSSSGGAGAGAGGILGSGTPLPPFNAAPPPQQQHQSQSYVEEGLDVPLHAPRLRVPTDLPLEQTTLIDLLAMMVVQGGPTTEEEIVKREMSRRNPAFAFLGEKYNHPCLLYYRWRLYSLLQQDTLLTWRTTPFQVEQARRAYVFVPPPVLRAGPESLARLYQPELLASAQGVGPSGTGGNTAGRAKRSRAEESGEEAEDTIVVVRKARRHRHRRTPSSSTAVNASPAATEAGDHAEVLQDGPEGSGQGRHADRGVVGTTERGVVEKLQKEKSSSGSSSGSDGDDDSSSGSESDGEAASVKRLQEVEEEREKAATTTDHSSPAVAAVDVAAGVGVNPPVLLPPPSAQWISRQCVVNKHVFAVLSPAVCAEWTRLLNPYLICAPSSCHSIAALSEKWLRRGEVATRMLFAVQHADGIHHLLSLLLDAVVRTAYVATARTRTPLPPPPPGQSSSSSTLDADSGVFCLEALWYLYVLHDILMNASNMPRAGDGCCVNKNPRTVSSSSSVTSQGVEEEDEALLTRPLESSPAAMEALYQAWKAQRGSTSTVGVYHSDASASGTQPPQRQQPPSPSLPGHPPSVPLVALSQRHRRRQRTARRRSPYERCGDALELILPTLLEAVTAIALAVSLDKERQAQPPSPPPPAAAAAADGDTSSPPRVPAPPPPRVHHFKVLNPSSSQRQQRKKSGGGEASGEGSAAALSAIPGGASVSLRLDAGCDAAVCMSATEQQQAQQQQRGNSDGLASDPSLPSSSSSSSAPAILLLEWLKALVLVWMNVEQPLRLPLPSTYPPPTESPTKRVDGAAVEEDEDNAIVAAAPLPPGLLWPDTAAGAPDTPDVVLAYHVDARHAHLLGLEAVTPTSHLHGPVPPSQEERSQPPLLSARACAIIKERYSFLF